jgi:hypothetical protein
MTNYDIKLKRLQNDYLWYKIWKTLQTDYLQYKIKNITSVFIQWKDTFNFKTFNLKSQILNLKL